jgi:hypothetical protein
VPLGIQSMSGKPILVWLRPRFRRMREVALFLLWLPPTHGPVAARAASLLLSIAWLIFTDVTRCQRPVIGLASALPKIAPPSCRQAHNAWDRFPRSA